jgi:hypothetical protein
MSNFITLTIRDRKGIRNIKWNPPMNLYIGPNGQTTFMPRIERRRLQRGYKGPTRNMKKKKLTSRNKIATLANGGNPLIGFKDKMTKSIKWLNRIIGLRRNK